MENETQQKQNKGMAIIAYILFFLPFLTGDIKDDFVKFHTKQSIILVLFSIIASTLLGMSIVGIPLLSLLNLIVIILFVMGIINANNGVKKELPLIGQYAEKILKF